MERGVYVVLSQRLLTVVSVAAVLAEEMLVKQCPLHRLD